MRRASDWVRLSEEYSPQELMRIVEVLLKALRCKDAYTFTHSQRVGRYAERLAREMKLSNDHIQAARILGTLHDIGKLFVPDQILLKPSELSPDQWVVMREHSTDAVQILACMGINHGYAAAIKGLHEWYNGQGYPDRLKGKKIPLLARILAVADCFDAMVTDRPYRKAVSTEAACGELRRERGKQFCPLVVDTFLEIVAKNDFLLPESQPQ